MAAIATEGEYIYLALEDAGGFPIIVRCDVGDLATFTVAYRPYAGTAANVASVPSNSNKILFYGNFGTDETIIEHTPSTGLNTDISPASLGSNVVNALSISPTNDDQIYITVSGNQDLLRTTDGGATWTTANAAVGFNPTGLAVVWPDGTKLFVAGETGGTSRLLWSTDSGATLTNQAGSALGSADNITNVELVLP